jgi:hypothetical protein
MFFTPSNRFRCDSGYEEAFDQSFSYLSFADAARTLLLQLAANLPRNNDWYGACVRLLAFWGSGEDALSHFIDDCDGLADGSAPLRVGRDGPARLLPT